MDIAKCDRLDCPIKDSCLRFTMPIPDCDQEWHYKEGDYADGHCSIYVPNGKSQYLTFSQAQRSPFSHADYGYLVANGIIKE